MRYSRVALVLAVAVATGCAGKPPERVAVRGKVTIGGAAMNGGTVAFTPDESKGHRGPPVHGIVRADGTYELKGADGPGAVPGWHRITVAPPPPPPGTTWSPRFDRYRDPDQSGLSVEVRAGQDNTVNLDLEGPGQS